MRTSQINQSLSFINFRKIPTRQLCHAEYNFIRSVILWMIWHLGLHLARKQTQRCGPQLGVSGYALWPTVSCQIPRCGPRSRVRLHPVAHGLVSDSALWCTVPSQIVPGVWSRARFRAVALGPVSDSVLWPTVPCQITPCGVRSRVRFRAVAHGPVSDSALWRTVPCQITPRGVRSRVRFRAVAYGPVSDYTLWRTVSCQIPRCSPRSRVRFRAVTHSEIIT
jgi:hypothetical protein